MARACGRSELALRDAHEERFACLVALDERRAASRFVAVRGAHRHCPLARGARSSSRSPAGLYPAAFVDLEDPLRGNLASSRSRVALRARTGLGLAPDEES